MSSDNGIYLLETLRAQGGFEYRIAYHMAVENYQWDDEKYEESDNPDVWIKNARSMWKDSEIFLDRDKAILKAHEMADEYPVLEYGVSTIKIDKEF